MRNDRIAQHRIGQLREHRCLHGRHDLARLGTEHREAENAVIARTDKNLHETLFLVGRLGAQYGTHRKLRNTRSDAFMVRLALA